MANYLNFTKAIFNPYNPKVLNEGQFSWITSDTDQQIGSERQNTIDVWMYDNEGNSWYENKYEGYGEFGGMDYYELLAKMNGYSEEDLKKGQEMRGIGIDLAFKKLKTKDRGRKVLFPALVANGKYNWKRHDFTEEAESDPNQSWYQEPEYDDYEDEYDDFYNEKEIKGKAAGNSIKMAPAGRTIEINGITYTCLGKGKWEGPDGEKVNWIEVSAMASALGNKKVVYEDDYYESEKPELTWDSLKESLGLNEGRSINKISKDHAQTVLDMAKTAGEWKEAEGDRKSELLEKLRELNKRKAELEKELDDAVAGKDRNLQLSLEEAEELAYLEIDVKKIFEDNGEEK